MYKAELKLEVSCPLHPDFDPVQEQASRRCRCCQSMAAIHDWVRMIGRSVARFDSGQYARGEIEVAVAEPEPKPGLESETVSLTELTAAPPPAALPARRPKVTPSGVKPACKKRAVASHIKQAPTALHG